jgi:membrane fusion protein, macrolide-specific efflux system
VTGVPKKRSMRWMGAIVVVLLVIGFIGLKVFRGGKPHLVYHDVTVGRGNIRTTILSTGTVAPENRLDLKPPVAGRIEKVLVQEGEKVHEGQILAWLSSSERATLIDTAMSQGKEEVAYWKDAYKMTPMLAPKRGLVILKNADAGQTVVQTDIVLSVSDRLIVKTNVDETDLAQIKNGQRVQVVLDAFAADILPGKVVHIGFDAKTVNNVTTYEVDVLADNTPDYMKSGMTANATFLIDEHKNTLIVPAAAVHKLEKRSYILIPNQESPNDPIEQDVAVGLSDGKKVEILSGVSEGDTVLMASLTSFAKDDKSVNPLSTFGNNRGRPGH